MGFYEGIKTCDDTTQYISTYMVRSKDISPGTIGIPNRRGIPCEEINSQRIMGCQDWCKDSHHGYNQSKGDTCY